MTRRGLAVEVDTSLPGGRVVRVLDSLIAEHGKPTMIVSDNGTELTCNAVLKMGRGPPPRLEAPRVLTLLFGLSHR